MYGKINYAIFCQVLLRPIVRVKFDMSIVALMERSGIKDHALTQTLKP